MNNAITSPFHRGEQLLQTRLGVRERMERFGQKMIRDYMPDQHRKFYQQLPYLVVGHADNNGWPWASILFGDQGFIQSPHEKYLQINTLPIAGDPLAQAITTGTPLGLLGIELNSRRRNRLTGHISQCDQQGFELRVDQAFGNCPKYIQQRDISGELTSISQTVIEPIQHLDTETQAFIARSDTFFVASYIASASGQASEGVDVSHRGGAPGFIRIDDKKSFTIPDYSGNFHFNTLGNFIENPKAGLLFIDFEQGHLLMLTGTVTLLWDSPEADNFEGAERLWTFQLNHGLRLKHALPIKWQLQEYSPFLPGNALSDKKQGI